jgi:hypothetical protein
LFYFVVGPLRAFAALRETAPWKRLVHAKALSRKEKQKIGHNQEISGVRAAAALQTITVDSID